MHLEGRVVLVTGSNRGIGKALVDAFVAAGASKVYAAMRKPESQASSKVVPVRIDVTDLASIQEAASKCSDVDVLVNNSGILLGQPLLGAADKDAAEREMRVNFFGTLQMCRAFAPVLKANGGGAIVNMLSILGRVSLPAVGSYSASKAAAFSLTQSVRAELTPQNTLVIGVLPAFVDTDMAARVPGPKLSPSQVADAVLAAIRDGVEDVYPGPSQEIAAQLQRDPKAVERQFANMLRRS